MSYKDSLATHRTYWTPFGSWRIGQQFPEWLALTMNWILWVFPDEERVCAQRSHWMHRDEESWLRKMSWFELHKLISQLRLSTFSSNLLGRKLSSSQSSTKNFRMSQVLRPFTWGKTLTVILSVVNAYTLHDDRET